MEELIICKELRFAYFACEVVRWPGPTLALLCFARFIDPVRWVIFLIVTHSLLLTISPIPTVATGTPYSDTQSVVLTSP